MKLLCSKCLNEAVISTTTLSFQGNPDDITMTTPRLFSETTEISGHVAFLVYNYQFYQLPLTSGSGDSSW